MHIFRTVQVIQYHSFQQWLIEKREIHKKQDIFLWKIVVSTIKIAGFPARKRYCDSYAVCLRTVQVMWYIVLCNIYILTLPTKMWSNVPHMWHHIQKKLAIGLHFCWYNALLIFEIVSSSCVAISVRKRRWKNEDVMSDRIACTYTVHLMWHLVKKH